MRNLSEASKKIIFKYLNRMTFIPEHSVFREDGKSVLLDKKDPDQRIPLSYIDLKNGAGFSRTESSLLKLWFPPH